MRLTKPKGWGGQKDANKGEKKTTDKEGSSAAVKPPFKRKAPTELLPLLPKGESNLLTRKSPPNQVKAKVRSRRLSQTFASRRKISFATKKRHQIVR